MPLETHGDWSRALQPAFSHKDTNILRLKLALTSVELEEHTPAWRCVLITLTVARGRWECTAKHMVTSRHTICSCISISQSPSSTDGRATKPHTSTHTVPEFHSCVHLGERDYKRRQRRTVMREKGTRGFVDSFTLSQIVSLLHSLLLYGYRDQLVAVSERNRRRAENALRVRERAGKVTDWKGVDEEKSTKPRANGKKEIFP